MDPSFQILDLLTLYDLLGTMLRAGSLHEFKTDISLTGIDAFNGHTYTKL